MRRTLMVFAAGTLMLACADSPTIPPADDLSPAFSAVVLTSNQMVPIALNVFIPCALDGAGEVASLTGNLHLLNHLTINNTGGVLVKTHA